LLFLFFGIRSGVFLFDTSYKPFYIQYRIGGGIFFIGSRPGRTDNTGLYNLCGGIFLLSEKQAIINRRLKSH